MIHILIALGITSYIIFSLGFFHFLFIPITQIIGLFLLITIIILLRKERLVSTEIYKELIQSKISLVFFSIIILQAGINLIGVFGPEIGFDALWYHLTLPKLYVQQQSISFIPGGLLYYSAMPKLGEMLYIIGLSFGGEVFPKLIHYSFGVISTCLLYKVLRLYVKPQMAIIGCTIFYSNLVVGWESTSAYIDLIRTAFEIGAMYCFLLWNKTNNKTWLWHTALLIGFATTTKLLALGTLGIFLFLILYIRFNKDTFISLSKDVIFFSCIALFIPFPWLLFSFLSTGNPVYPFFTSLYPVSHSFSLVNPMSIVNDILHLLLFSPDPISILYLVFIPLLVYCYKNFSREQKIFALYCLLSIVVWYITPRTGGGRFILPYLPVWSGVIILIIQQFNNKNNWMNMFLIIIVLTTSLSVGYRLLANSKYIPYIVTKESKAMFLQKNLDFSYGDFFDVDGRMSEVIGNNKTLLIGFHNLYYIDFPYIHESWVKKGDTFTYVAVQNAVLPKRFTSWKKIYENSNTQVALYTIGKSVTY